MKISIVMPVYNEEETVETILKRALEVKLSWEKEIVVVNDGSRDKTEGKIKRFKDKIIYIRQENQGKGAAVMAGISRATGDYIVIQDADLEYNPEDIERMVQAVNNNNVVYGSRLTEPPVLFGKRRTPILLHYFGNKFLSLITSLLYGTWLTDMETCYKLFPKKALDKIKINARGFEFEPEITAKLLKSGYKIKEIPITTKPRGYDEGKKLDTWKDGWQALTTLVKYRFIN